MKRVVTDHARMISFSPSCSLSSDQPTWRIRAAGTLGHLPRASWALAVALGFAFAFGITLADRAWAPWLGESWQLTYGGTAGPETLDRLVLGIGYGGLTEEVMMRWGLMSGIVWLTATVTRPRAVAGVGERTHWVGLILSAIVFALAHLPAVAAEVPLTAAVVARTLTFNALGGLLFGWVYWRRGLEVGMLAHASTHAGFAILR